MKKKLEKPNRAEASNSLSVTDKYETIKLGIDWHAREYRVVRIVDHAGPEPAQRFDPVSFGPWVSKQLALAKKVYCCYESGAGGFVLHRQLTQLGAVNYVVAPRKLDRTHTRVQNDKLDARELALDLDRYVRGNAKALQVIYVPTPEQERRRQQSRQRKQLVSHRLSLAAQGRSLLLNQGWVRSNLWWKPARWEELEKKLPAWMIERLEIYRRLILAADQEIKPLTQVIQKAAAPERPLGMGALTAEELQREIGDWKRFGNRKGIGSYAGLAGGVSASGDYKCDLPITKAGNRRLRTIMIELAWRWVLYQSQCPLVQRWKVLLDHHAHARVRKRAVVALARSLLVDLWRWQTQRQNPRQLGWIMRTDPSVN